MNRKEEYHALLSELEQLPPELEQTVERAVRRKRKLRNKRRFWGIPVGSLAACFLEPVGTYQYCGSLPRRLHGPHLSPPPCNTIMSSPLGRPKQKWASPHR